MEDVAGPSFIQTTDQILGLADIEEDVDGGLEEAATESEQVPEVVPVTRKRGRPRKSQNVEQSSTVVRRSTRKNS